MGNQPPVRVVVSRTVVPTGPPGEEASSRPGVRLAMVRVKVWHADGLTPFVPHTVVGPNTPAEVGTPVTKPAGVRLRPGGRLPLVTSKVGSGVWGEVWNWWM